MEVQRLIAAGAAALGQHVVQAGGCRLLFQDVLHSMVAWAPAAARSVLQKALMTGEAAACAPSPSDLTGEQLDAAFATLRLLNTRLAALCGMPHEPACSHEAPPGIRLAAQSWLLPHQAARGYMYAYELQLANKAPEPLRLVQQVLEVRELSGARRTRTSPGLSGLQPVIDKGATLAHRTGVTLSSIKGCVKAAFMFRGVDSGAMFTAQVPDFALTPTAQQFADDSIICWEQSQQQALQARPAAAPPAVCGAKAVALATVRSLFPLVNGLPAPSATAAGLLCARPVESEAALAAPRPEC